MFKMSSRCCRQTVAKSTLWANLSLKLVCALTDLQGLKQALYVSVMASCACADATVAMFATLKIPATWQS